ncbi:uncharacterized protein LOC133842862 [Drosophila sulfurigaster albostrigata]|uniref:uncharacterized protein LOC133842862 n=1 Tax=Drosophila sulfurigaster albostrigata TaxID=89887 RepID=UPI002D21A19D|nr:uncharacterized protein LOC133842862 [Drosophila sulfurigaster albostrigata]
MYKRFRKSKEQIIIAENSSSDEEKNVDEVSQIIVRRRPANNQKYVPICRSKTVCLDDSRISDASTDGEQEQENKRCLLNSNRCRDNSKALHLTPSNKFQPLSVAISGKKMSPASLSSSPTLNNLNKCSPKTPPAVVISVKNMSPTSSSLSTTLCNLMKCSPGTPPTAWHSLKRTLATLKRERSVLQTSILDASYVDSTPSPSLESNLSTLIAKQPMLHNAKVYSAQKKHRCVKGGYLQEYKRLIQKQRMDRRSLQHNQRLGISPGQRVQVVAINESFGVHMARVQEIEGDANNFNVIVDRQMAARIVVGSNLELYFDPKAEAPLQMSNKQLVYIEPNKLVLL